MIVILEEMEKDELVKMNYRHERWTGKGGQYKERETRPYRQVLYCRLFLVLGDPFTDVRDGLALDERL